VVQLVEALRYGLEGRGFDIDGFIGIFHWFHLSGFTVALGSAQFLVEMSTGLRAEQPYQIILPIFLKSGRFNLLEPSGLCLGL
jgi:hypothetical protein